jgi:5-methylcytosine-specific restriction endonuclease McrA
MLTEKSPHARYPLRSRLLNNNILKNECYICGISEWLGKPLSLDLDHINGISDDNRLENLRMLCPNCHSQTETYRGRNKKLRKNANKTEEERHLRDDTH